MNLNNIEAVGEQESSTAIRKPTAHLITPKGKFLLIEMIPETKEYLVHKNALTMKLEGSRLVQEIINTEFNWKLIGVANELTKGTTNFKELCQSLEMNFNKTLVFKQQ